MKHIPLKSLFIFSVAAFLVLLAATAAFAGAPTGGSPNDPMMVPKDWQTISPNTTLWFYFDYAAGGSGVPGGGPAGGPRGGTSTTSSNATVALDANGVSGIQFAIYTPDQGKDWLRDQKTSPVGRGAPFRETSNGNISRDLYWTGAFNTSGRYFIAVTNASSAAISYRLTVTGDTVTLYPSPTVTPTATLFAPITVTPVATGTIQGKIVFETATGGVIYTVNGDGSDLKLLTNGIDPTWSPDGKQIAFARWSATLPGLYVINADGSNEHLVYSAPKIRWARWSADGKYIAFAQEKTSGRETKWKLGVVELNKVIDTETTKNALTEPQCTDLCYSPSWGTDGVTLAYTDPGVGIMATSIISGSAKLVMGPTGVYYDTNKGVALPIEHLPTIQSSEWSPDGKSIIYAQATHDRWELNVVSADGSNRTSITSPDPILYVLFSQVVNNVAPTWSPDSKQVLFLSDRNGKWEFFVANADGSNVRQVLKNVTDQIPLRFDYENEHIMDWVK